MFKNIFSYRATPLAASEYLGIPFCKTFANGCLLKEGFLKLLKSYNNLAILWTKLLKMPGNGISF